ncbi:DUF418 domain-containing protein [Novosphingobium sp. 1949]|uniref:DUF418 domain-containing protein n=1 Tax=Novosphingobium organovorum TaxID=2930092 RepID=A0ABT0BHJ5_9SPHN|nr:DUF418 domain-containing protein [Novosphingobium organovorum]MCJ2184542.1 DUF418 domain-containing protein [Novosphingobium organovorum]
MNHAAFTAATVKRLPALDLIRGVAVLGILAINIAGFAGPLAGTISPALTASGTPYSSAWDNAAFAFSLVLFEGKMRALFSMLFGAGLVLFWESLEARGDNGDVLQLRRLSWLLLFGLLHYLLLWWGDILFVYALCGIAALMLRPLSDRRLIATALLLYYGWHLWGLFDLVPLVHAETAVRLGRASAEQAAHVHQWLEAARAGIVEDLAEAHYGYARLLVTKLSDRPFWLFHMTRHIFSETLPLILIGMVMVRRGFFDPTAHPRHLRAAAIACTAGGLGLSLAFTLWAEPRGFPPIAMEAALSWGLAMPHLLGGYGYAALLVLVTPYLAARPIGRRLRAAGRMAFSNYIATSLIMTTVFYGWGLGQFGRFGPALQGPFVLLGWGLMLGWSAPVLRHFRRGPLEWIWRCLVEKRWLSNRF